jgi:hypothetical protein
VADLHARDLQWRPAPAVWPDARPVVAAARIGGRRDLRFRADWIDAWLEQSAAPVEVRR